MTGCYSDTRRSLDSNDIRSYSVKAYMVKNPSPPMICFVVIGLGYCIICNDSYIKLPRVITTSIDWVTGPPIKRVGFRCRRTELAESQLQNDHVL